MRQDRIHRMRRNLYVITTTTATAPPVSLTSHMSRSLRNASAPDRGRTPSSHSVWHTQTNEGMRGIRRRWKGGGPARGSNLSRPSRQGRFQLTDECTVSAMTHRHAVCIHEHAVDILDYHHGAFLHDEICGRACGNQHRSMAGR